MGEGNLRYHQTLKVQHHETPSITALEFVKARCYYWSILLPTYFGFTKQMPMKVLKCFCFFPLTRSVSSITVQCQSVSKL